MMSCTDEVMKMESEQIKTMEELLKKKQANLARLAELETQETKDLKAEDSEIDRQIRALMSTAFPNGGVLDGDLFKITYAVSPDFAVSDRLLQEFPIESRTLIGQCPQFLEISASNMNAFLKFISADKDKAAKLKAAATVGQSFSVRVSKKNVE